MRLTKILKHSLLFILLGLVPLFLLILIQIAPLVVYAVSPDMGLIDVSLATNLFLFFNFPLYALLFLYAGIRSAQRGLDVVESGLVGAFSYVIISIVRIVITALISFLSVSGYADILLVDFESALIGILFPSFDPNQAIIVNSVCGVALTFFGALLNFSISGLGAIFRLERKYVKR